MSKKPVRLNADTLIQGISQQVETLRTLNHVSDSLNILPSIVDGNKKRPSFDLVSRINLPYTLPPAVHFYERDTVERYIVSVFDGPSGRDLKVFDQITGAEKTVTFPNGKAYLNSPGSPKGDFSFLTLADYTFVLNKTKTVAMTGALSPAAANVALLYVKQGDYSTTYQVFINGTQRATVTTSATDNSQTATTWIMGQLRSQLATFFGAGPFTITGSGSYLLITRTDGVPFTMTATDSLSGTGIRVVRDTIQRFENLPDRAPNGFIVKVAYDERRDHDDYYVKFVAHDATNTESTGIWTETVGPSVSTTIDPTTMPHILVRMPEGSFEFRQANWDQRTAGDDNTVPLPSFIGRKINHVYFFQNRLGLLAGGNVVASRVSEYFAFFRTTARTALDGDPVDIAATTAEALTLRYAIPFERRLVIFADNAQLISEGGSAYTPNTASLKVSSEYEMDPTIQPVSVGQSVFFATRKGEYLSVLELRSSDQTDKTIALEITEHVPKLIPAKNYSLVASDKEKLLTLIPEDGGDMFAYHWMWADNSRVVSSWRRLGMAAGIKPLSASFVGNALLLIGEFGTRRVYGSLTFDVEGAWKGALTDTHMDLRRTVAGTYNGTLNQTTLQLPLDYGTPTILTLDGGMVRDISNQIVSTTSLTAGSTDVTSPLQQVVLKGNWSSVMVGRVFPILLKFSRPYPKKFGPRGEIITDTTGRLQLSKLFLDFTDTGPFWVTVQHPYRANLDHHFSGLVIGGVSTVLGGPPISSGSFKVPLGGQADELTITLHSQSWTPLCLTSAEWLGSLIPRMK